MTTVSDDAGDKYEFIKYLFDSRGKATCSNENTLPHSITKIHLTILIELGPEVVWLVVQVTAKIFSKRVMLIEYMR